MLDGSRYLRREMGGGDLGTAIRAGRAIASFLLARSPSAARPIVALIADGSPLLKLWKAVGPEATVSVSGVVT